METCRNKMKNILEKLKNIQSELKAEKSQYNNFGKYRYRSVEDLMEALKPLLVKHNATISISSHLEPVGSIIVRETTARLLCCETAEEIHSTIQVQETLEAKGMSPTQCSGSSNSYSSKYCLGALFLIDDTKDADATNKHDTEAPAPSKPATFNKKHPDYQKAVEYFKKHGHLEAVEKKYKISDAVKKSIEEEAQ